MKKLFETTSIRSMTLKNRFVGSATWMGLANPDGSCSPELIDHAVRLARGDVGLVITELAFVSPGSQTVDKQLGAHSDDLLPGLGRMTDRVHAAGGKIAMQLAHAGLFAMSQATGQQPSGPSVMATAQGPLGREMSCQEIRQAVRAFGEAAARAKKAGFDGVQVHAGHGFLLSQFLSPFFNKRTDEYGGSLANRARIVLETVGSVRQGLGDNGLPLLVKINSSDFLQGGFTVEEMLQVALMLERAGVDAVELSGGTHYGFTIPNPDITYAPISRSGVYYEEAAKRLKTAVSLPLILVGGIRSLVAAKRLVEQGAADYVSLSRPLIRQPDLVRRWGSGDTRDAECLSDDACIQPGLEGQGVHCVHARGYRRKQGLLRFYSGSTGAVNTKRAVVECLENALGEGALDCDLLIFYTTMGHNFPDILSEARRLCPGAQIVGCTCAGIIGREGPNESMRALAVMAVKGPDKGFAVAGVASIVGMDPYESGQRIARELKGKNPDITMILFNACTMDIIPAGRAIDGIQSIFGPDVPVFGGMSLDNMKMVSSFQFLGDRVFERGAVAVGFADPTLEVISMANHGFTVIGEPFTVTRSDGCRVYELDATPAWRSITGRLGLSEYAHPVEVAAFAELAEELPGELHEEYGSGYIIRAGGSLNEADGSVYISAPRPVGTRLWLVKRDEKGILEGIDHLTGLIVQRCKGRRPIAVFHADCALRGKLFVNKVLKDEIVSRIQHPLCRGGNVPWLGMYGGGEITGLGGRSRVHVFTTSLYVIVEREG